MPKFSKESLDKLATCDVRLQKVFNEVIKHVDCTIIEGHRGQEKQDEYYRTGKSQKKWPNGEHNATPSRAVDAMVYPVDWSDKGTTRQCLFAGFVLGTAKSLGITLRWGGDWDSDYNLREHTLFDTPHFEVVD